MAFSMDADDDDDVADDTRDKPSAKPSTASTGRPKERAFRFDDGVETVTAADGPKGTKPGEKGGPKKSGPAGPTAFSMDADDDCTQGTGGDSSTGPPGEDRRKGKGSRTLQKSSPQSSISFSGRPSPETSRANSKSDTKAMSEESFGAPVASWIGMLGGVTEARSKLDHPYFNKPLGHSTYITYNMRGILIGLSHAPRQLPMSQHLPRRLKSVAVSPPWLWRFARRRIEHHP